MEETKLVESLEQSHLPTQISCNAIFKDENARNAEYRFSIRAGLL